jgi:tRNA (mo5U34)-methyltransferase
MDEKVLRERIASFPRWHYQFDLQGIKTAAAKPGLAHRHEERIRYFFDPLVDLFGGSLKGKRVLDLGCNAGFWSLQAIEAGCDYVLGIDGRQMHIDQANLVFEVKQVDKSRYQFRTGNVFTEDFSREGPFDVVLCLGLLYHVSRPVELFEKISAVNTDVLVVDTATSMAGGASMKFRHESIDAAPNAVDYEMVFDPSRRAVIDMVRCFGYSVVPLAMNASSYEGMKGYFWGRRVAFMCAKKTDLSSLPALPADEALARLENFTRNMFRDMRVALSMARKTLRSKLKPPKPRDRRTPAAPVLASQPAQNHHADINRAGRR